MIDLHRTLVKYKSWISEIKLPLPTLQRLLRSLNYIADFHKDLTKKLQYYGVV